MRMSDQFRADLEHFILKTSSKKNALNSSNALSAIPESEPDYISQLLNIALIEVPQIPISRHRVPVYSKKYDFGPGIGK